MSAKGPSFWKTTSPSSPPVLPAPSSPTTSENTAAAAADPVMKVEIMADTVKRTPSTTPSTSQNEGEASSLLDISSASLRDDSNKTGVLLSSAQLEAGFLWKQPSKRRLFAGINTQKRFFVLTANELAYKEKDNEEQDFKVVWKIPSEVLSVDLPEGNAKEFGVVVMDNNARRVVKLSASDNATATKFANAINAAITAAKAKTEGTTATTTSSTSSTATAEAEKAAGGEKTLNELAITDAGAQSTDSSVAGDDASQGSAEDAVMNAERADIVSGENATGVATAADDIVSIPVDEPKSEAKSAVWFWGMCCSAE